MRTSAIRRGDVWWIDLDPTRGHEQAGRRPALVLSVDQLNRSAAGLMMVVPITRTARGVRSHVEIAPPDAGLRETSFAMCEALRSVSRERLSRRLGTVSPHVLAQVEDRLRILLGL